MSEYIYFNGKRVARRDADNSVKYYFSDNLGSASVVTDSLGVIKNESDYYPYGGEIPITNGDPNHYKFTGKERDAESGLDYFGARYYGSSLGRFMTPDWAAKATAVPYATFGNPQSLNLYSYVKNSPEALDDPDGHGALNASTYSASNGYLQYVERGFGFQARQTPPAPQPQQQGAPQQAAQNKKQPGGLVYTPRDMPDGGAGILGQLFGKLLDFLGITFVTPSHGDTLSDDPPVPIPIPKNLLWIDQIINGHGWEDHGKDVFASKEEYKQMVLDTVQNAKGGDIVRNPGGRKGVTGFWNDSEGFVVWRDKNHPDQGTAFHPDQPDVYKKTWGFE